jgi:hypothetical protein
LFGGAEAPDDADMFDARHWPEALPETADEALAMLDGAYEHWRSGVAALDDAALLRPIGPRGGPFAEEAMAALVQHVNREVMAHGAEICLLRDLYRAHRDRRDPVVAAALRGDAAARAAAADDGEPVRPTLVSEAAGLHHWDVVRALVDAGVSPTGGSPTALHFAAGAGELDVVRLLVAHGADTAALDDRFGRDPAGWADFFQHDEISSYLRGLSDQD